MNRVAKLRSDDDVVFDDDDVYDDNSDDGNHANSVV